MKERYLTLLNTALVTPKGSLFRRPSGYYPIDAQNKLYLLENKICLLAKELNQDLRPWCQSEKQKVIQASVRPIHPQRLGLIAAVSLPAIIILIIVTLWISRLQAKDAISAFERQMAHADSLFYATQYEGALISYRKAADEYKASYRKAEHIAIANAGIQKASSKILEAAINDSRILSDEDNYYEAYKVLTNIPFEPEDCSDVEMVEQFRTLRSELEIKCQNLLESEIQDIIKIIHQEKGAVPAETMERIDYLLSIDPSNYWLLFIQNNPGNE